MFIPVLWISHAAAAAVVCSSDHCGGVDEGFARWCGCCGFETKMRLWELPGMPLQIILFCCEN